MNKNALSITLLALAFVFHPCVTASAADETQTGFAKKKKENRREPAMAALKSVGMDSMAKKAVSKLSGGQKQRVTIARAIVNEPSFILADEPTGALDSKTAEEIMTVFKELHSRGKTIILVTHDQSIAAQCERIIEIADGCVTG